MKTNPFQLFFMLLLLASMVLYSACNNEDVQIRIDNQTGSDFVSVLVNSNGNENTYGSLPDGEQSEYKVYPQAYRYGYVEAITTTDDTLIVQPIDYVGESPLDEGKYTYKLTRDNPNSPWMGLELE